MLNQLPEYGLTEIQAKVYYHLLRLGKTSSTEVSKNVGVHRSEVYRVLRELAEKGIVTEHKNIRPILFTPARPQVALALLLQEQEMKLKNRRDNLPRLVGWLNSHANVRKMRASILLVDDDEIIRKGVSNALHEEGFSVDTASNGKQALEKSQLRHYDLALVDIRLPDMEGTKLLKMLKEKTPEIKEIIITGYPSIENAVQAVNDGADAYLIKPIKPADLLAKIRQKMEE
jgi:CheY-like chemotaxis protein